jgi:hypothetical protein
MTGSAGGSDGGAVTARTSFWDQVAADSAAIASGGLGEVVRYRSGGGATAVELSAVVMRDPERSDLAHVRDQLRLFVPRQDGWPTVVEPGDDLAEIPVTYGAALTVCRVLRVAERSPAHWVLEVAS